MTMSIMMSQLKKAYRTAKTIQEKRYIMSKITCEHARYFRVRNLTKCITGMHCRKTSEQKLTNIPRKKIKLVMDFYERDDNSRATAGKKETIKRKQIKKQKRYLNDNMKILHKKFRSENPEINVLFFVLCSKTFLGTYP